MALLDDLHPIEDRARVGQVGVVRGQKLGDLAAGELLQQRQQAMRRSCRNRSCRSGQRAQAVEHRVIVAPGRYCSSATTRFSRPIMFLGMFFSLSLASIWTITSQALGRSWRNNAWRTDEQRVDVDDVALISM